MFCFQCEQTAGGKGCTTGGVCGKNDTVAKLQDVLLELTKGIAVYATAAREKGEVKECMEKFILEALFTTVTNVNFDEVKLQEIIAKAAMVKDKAQEMAGGAEVAGTASFKAATDLAGLLAQADSVSVEARKAVVGDDASSLQEIICYGLKGAAAYADHAGVLGKTDSEMNGQFAEALAFLTRTDATVDELVGWALKTGEINLKAMEILDAGNTETYGHPVPTEVNVNPVKGKAILISGHDLKDLKMLLEQTEGKGVNIYTHGEMIPAHGYPELHKHAHLVGNYGGAWQDQKKEFAAFPGSILMTTNCIQKPTDTYNARIFTTGLVAFPGVNHIGDDKNFAAVIDAALAADGFAEDAATHKIMVGFARNAVLGVADKVIDAVKSGAIKRFFLVGGCDGAKPGRNYYTELAEKIPQDCVIMTLACGKYRFNKMDFGDIGGIPRLLDVGQCNDAYSAVQIAVALAGAFDCGVNDLPLSIVLSWYEQKAVAVLLSLFSLGVQNIKLGPTLPAFITPNVLNVLVENFKIAPVTTPDADLKEILG